MSRDIYIVSVVRGARVQLGPRSRTPSKWRKLSREEVRRAIRNAIAPMAFGRGVKVWTETRRETARVALVYGIRPRTLAVDNPRRRS